MTVYEHNQDGQDLVDARNLLLPGMQIIFSGDKDFEGDIMVDFTNLRLVIMVYSFKKKETKKSIIDLGEIRDKSYEGKLSALVEGMKKELA